MSRTDGRRGLKGLADPDMCRARSHPDLRAATRKPRSLPTLPSVDTNRTHPSRDCLHEAGSLWLRAPIGGFAASSQRLTIHLKTWGDFAGFSRPEMKVERVSHAGPYRDGAAPCPTGNHVIRAFLEMVFDQTLRLSNN